jgi:tripartite-type tricarboxylate transporter receptor subunit TctC
VPDILTIAEAGLASYDANSWVSVVAPARTLTAIAEQLRAAFRHIVASAEFKQYLATQTDLAQSVAQRGVIGTKAAVT